MTADESTTRADLDWEETACLMCGEHGSSGVVEIPMQASNAGTLPARVVRCDGCGLCYTNPRPTPAAMARFYPTEYPAHEVRHVARPTKLRTWWRRATSASPERAGVPWHGQGRLLDFGCGGGAFLQRMRHDGWQVTGVDASAAVVTRLREQLGLTVLVGDLSHKDLVAGSFDVVTMWQSLEHVHHPLDLLRQAYQLLAPGGRLMISVPNIDSLAFRWFGPAWFGLDLPRHLTHFTPSTLRRMVAEAGFEIDKLWMIPHSSWLQRSARAASRLRLFRWRWPCRMVTRWCVTTGQADAMGISATKPR